MKLGYGEDEQRQQYEYMQSEEYWPQVGPFGGPFDPNVAGSGGLFGHSTYIENNPGAQWVRWETALVDHEWNSGVEYVAGSHRRWRSDFENDVLVPEKKKEEIPDFVRVLPEGVGSTAMTGGRNGKHSGDSIMPGAAVVPIKSGQTVFWNGNGLHRGRTTGGVERISLAGGWAGPPPGGWEKMEREGPTPEQQDQYPAQIIQWKLNPAFRDSLPSEWMKKSWDRWHMLQANQIPMAAYDVWTEESQYTRVGDDYVQTAEVTAEASDN